MSREDFKASLEALQQDLWAVKQDDDAYLLKTIIEGYEQAFEGKTVSIPEPEKVLTEAVEAPVEANTNQSFIDALNGDLSREYQAAIQYIQHASVMEGAEFISIMEELMAHADEEIAHAKKISDRIDYLGGVPVATMEQAKISPDAIEMLEQDKASEEEAITRYKERIEQAESMKDYGSKNMLMDILEEEEEHRNDLIIALGKKSTPVNEEEEPDLMKGGLADDKKVDDFNPAQIEMGKKVESEHTEDEDIATEITKDHLTEDPKYYDKLKEIEDK